MYGKEGQVYVLYVFHYGISVMYPYSKFPPDILTDKPTMEVLALCASRIEHMQVSDQLSMYMYLSLSLSLSPPLSLFPDEMVNTESCIKYFYCCSCCFVISLQIPRYQSLKKVLTNILCNYLTIQDDDKTNLSLLKREELLLEYISDLPRNMEDKSKFIEKYGYSERFMRGVSHTQTDTATHSHIHAHTDTHCYSYNIIIIIVTLPP